MLAGNIVTLAKLSKTNIPRSFLATFPNIKINTGPSKFQILDQAWPFAAVQSSGSEAILNTYRYVLVLHWMNISIQYSVFLVKIGLSLVLCCEPMFIHVAEYLHEQ